MYFLYDAAKDASNQEKHGIGFGGGRGLWNDRGLVEMAAKKRGERRRMVIAKMGGVCWTAIIAYRGIAVRIISVRRSTKKEARFYDRCNNRRKP